MIQIILSPDNRGVVPYAPGRGRVGHEAGALLPWLHPALLAQGLPAICLEAGRMHAAPSAQRNQTDAADALGIVISHL